MGDMSNATAPLPNQHGTAWDATDDTELIAAVGAALAGKGGEVFLTPAAGWDDLSWRVARGGRLWGPTDEMVAGAPNSCHGNVAALCAGDPSLSHAFGWALTPDGMWRVHSWAVRDDGSTVDTTMERTAYFGVVLTDSERERFAVREPSLGEMVKVHVTFDDPEGFSGETLWATPVEGGYRIENVPFFAGAFTIGSVVTASPLGGGLEIDGVVSHAYDATIGVLFDGDVTEDAMVSTVDTLAELGCRVERATGPVWSAAVPHGARERVLEVLDAARCTYEVNVLEQPS